MSKHPEVLWAQRSSATVDEKNTLIVTVNLTDIDESSLQCDLQPTGLHFKAQAGTGVPKTEYEFKIDFFKEIITEKTEKRLTSRSVVLQLRKKDVEQEYWPRLTKEKSKNAYIKTDFSKWVDEDEQEETSPAAAMDDEMNFGGMDMGGGIPGMPGGMPGGMGGGMPGLGDMDFEKMMQQMPPPGDAGDAGDVESPVVGAGSDSDSDSSDPPPLE